jgi:hypothetical protein
MALSCGDVRENFLCTLLCAGRRRGVKSRLKRVGWRQVAVAGSPAGDARTGVHCLVAHA